MGLILTDWVMVAHRWDGSPHVGQCIPGIITHWMEDVASMDSWMPCRDEIHLSTLDTMLYTLDVDPPLMMTSHFRV
jgi:hypothetical protein